MVELGANHYTPTGAGSIPTGEIASVAGTPLDFRTPHAVGERIKENFEQLVMARGYDQNFVVNGTPGTLRGAARVTEPEHGRTLTVETTQPGVQFYTGNFLDGSVTGRHGKKYTQRTGLCLETQAFPTRPTTQFSPVRYCGRERPSSPRPRLRLGWNRRYRPGRSLDVPRERAQAPRCSCCWDVLAADPAFIAQLVDRSKR